MRAELPTPNNIAWRLIQDCPWSLNTSEKFAVLALARIHQDGYEWASAGMVADVWRCSETNAKEFLNRPRINQETYPLVETRRAEGKDGKTRVYYRLVGWEGYE